MTPAVRSNSGGGFCVIPLARNLGLEIVRVLFLCIFFGSRDLYDLFLSISSLYLLVSRPLAKNLYGFTLICPSFHPCMRASHLI